MKNKKMPKIKGHQISLINWGGKSDGQARASIKHLSQRVYTRDIQKQGPRLERGYMITWSGQWQHTTGALTLAIFSDGPHRTGVAVNSWPSSYG